MQSPGTVTLIGSGETSSTGGQVFEALAQQLPSPLEVAILETPAGFEVNSARVARRVAEFLEVRLQNYRPRIRLIPARKKGTPFSPDAVDVVRPLYDSQMIFFGPGSPTYTVRQLEGSLAWQILQARHRLGASLVLASAATIAAGSLALPVYEIFKAGDELHWRAGLDFFQPYGLSLVIIPHWNNREGGDEVDTSRCFMGQQRFDALADLLPPNQVILGIDEHTSLTIDFGSQDCQVSGLGEVHLIKDDSQQNFATGSRFSIQELGNFQPLPSPDSGLSRQVWLQAFEKERSQQVGISRLPEIPDEVKQLVEERQAVRLARDWSRSDQLRDQIATLGWLVKDTPSGPVLQPDKD